jgi:hypothetical protein
MFIDQTQPEDSGGIWEISSDDLDRISGGIYKAGGFVPDPNVGSAGAGAGGDGMRLRALLLSMQASCRAITLTHVVRVCDPE